MKYVVSMSEKYVILLLLLIGTKLSNTNIKSSINLIQLILTSKFVDNLYNIVGRISIK